MKNFKKFKAFNLSELVVTVAIIGIASTISVPKLFPMIKEFRVKENVLATEQAIKEARSIAIKKSSTIYIDFSKATSTTTSSGGLIEIKDDADDSVLKQIYLDEKTIYNATQSTIDNSVIYFDYKGRPVDSSGDLAGFSTSNNQVSISNSGSDKIIKSLTISPITGQIIID